MYLDFAQLTSVLCLGAHPDDIEIGCGGTLLRLLAARPDVQLDWAVFSGTPRRRAEAEAAFQRWTRGCSNCRFHAYDFPDAYFPAQFEPLKQCLHDLAAASSPQLVFTHRRDDWHQDHRLLAELTWNAFRGHVILEYEIPKYEGDLGQPNLFTPLPADLAERKVDWLMDCFPSQTQRDWFQPETFRALLRLRGLEAKAASGWAEAFHARKLWFGCGGPLDPPE